MSSWRYNLSDYIGSANGKASSRGLVIRAVGDIADPGGSSGGGAVSHPPSTATAVAPSINETVYTPEPYKSGTLSIMRVSDEHVYTPGVDFEEVAPYQWTNLAITPDTEIELSYLVDVGAGSSAVQLQLEGTPLPAAGTWNLEEGFEAEYDPLTNTINITALGGGGTATFRYATLVKFGL